MKHFFDTELWKWIRLLIEVALIGAIILAFPFVIRSFAGAEVIPEQVWVLCEPTGTVNIRSSPGGPVFAGATCGAEMWTDNKQRSGFLHVMELAAEEDEGWISGRYIVYDEPREINGPMAVTGNGRVACRTWIGGKIKGWIQPGDGVYVFWMSSECAVTDCGYIRSEFLEVIR